jgi:hypothetical protein
MKFVASQSQTMRAAAIVSVVVALCVGLLIYLGLRPDPARSDSAASRSSSDVARQEATAAGEVKQAREKELDEAMARAWDQPAYKAAFPITNEQLANPNDVRQARQFLHALPPACKNSRGAAMGNGAVRIELACQTEAQSLGGIVQFKDGVVTEIADKR